MQLTIIYRNLIDFHTVGTKLYFWTDGEDTVFETPIGEEEVVPSEAPAPAEERTEPETAPTDPSPAPTPAATPPPVREYAAFVREVTTLESLLNAFSTMRLYL